LKEKVLRVAESQLREKAHVVSGTQKGPQSGNFLRPIRVANL